MEKYEPPTWNKTGPWYVVVGNGTEDREDGFPLMIYADKKIAQAVAKANKERVVEVMPQTPKFTPPQPRSIDEPNE